MSAALYGKVLSRLWQDPEIRALEPEDFRLFVYLLSNEHRSISGVYYLPVPLAAYELERTADQVGRGLEALRPWVVYDGLTGEVWVRSLAAVNVDHDRHQPLKTGDKRRFALVASVEAIRSQVLRDLWLSHYSAWGMGSPSTIPIPSPSEVPSDDSPTGAVKGLPCPTYAGGPPPALQQSAVSSQQIGASEGSNEPSGDPPGEPEKKPNPLGELMPLVRQHLYVPDGKPPADWDDGRDATILRTLLRLDKPDIIAQAIEGLALMRDDGSLERWDPPVRPGDKLTMRLLFHTNNGVLPLFEQAVNHLQHKLAARAFRPRGVKSFPTSVASLVKTGSWEPGA